MYPPRGVLKQKTLRPVIFLSIKTLRPVIFLYKKLCAPWFGKAEKIKRPVIIMYKKSQAPSLSSSMCSAFAWSHHSLVGGMELSSAHTGSCYKWIEDSSKELLYMEKGLIQWVVIDGVRISTESCYRWSKNSCRERWSENLYLSMCTRYWRRENRRQGKKSICPVILRWKKVFTPWFLGFQKKYVPWFSKGK